MVDFYNQNKTSLPVWSDKVLLDQIVRNSMIERAQKDGGIGFKGIEAWYSLLTKAAFVGIVGQYVSYRIEGTTYNGAVLGESKFHSDKKKIEDLGIGYEKTKDGHKYILPISGNDIPQELKDLGAKETIQDGKKEIILESESPLDIHMSKIYHMDGSIETRTTLNKKKLSSVTQNSPQPIVETSTNPTKPQEVTWIDALSGRDKVIDARAGSLYYMRRNNKWNGDKQEFKTFNLAISDISDKNYASALTKLEAYKSKSKVVKDILNELNNDGKLTEQPERLAVLLTYTYGGEKSKNLSDTVDVKSKDYTSMRKSSLASEKKLGIWNPAAETYFEGQSHGTKNLNIHFPWQAMDVRVYATPKGGQAKMDHFPGSVTVTDKVYRDLTDSQKEELIKDHTSSIQKKHLNWMITSKNR